MSIVNDINLMIIKIFRPNSGQCICNHNGNKTGQSFDIRDGYWCCKTSTEECTAEDSGNRTQLYKKVTCIGNQLKLSQACLIDNIKQPVCNHYPSDKERDGLFRSYIDLCGDNR